MVWTQEYQLLVCRDLPGEDSLITTKLTNQNQDQRHKCHHLTMTLHLTLKMTTAQVVETSVTNNSLSKDYLHPEDHDKPLTVYVHIWSALWEGFHSWAHKKSLTCSHRKIFMVNLLKIWHVYPHYSGWEVNFVVETFPQCSRYIYILIYIKGSKFLQTVVYIYDLYLINIISKHIMLQYAT